MLVETPAQPSEPLSIEPRLPPTALDHGNHAENVVCHVVVGCGLQELLLPKPQQASPLKLGWWLRPQELQNCRHNFQQANGLVDPRWKRGRSKRPMDNQRHPERALIDEIAVRGLAVPAEALPPDPM